MTVKRDDFVYAKLSQYRGIFPNLMNAQTKQYSTLVQRSNDNLHMLINVHENKIYEFLF